MAYFGENAIGAWINFNGQGTISGSSIRDSFNITSVADNNTGTYTVSFSTAFSNDNYCGFCSGGHRSNSSTPRGFETVYNYGTASCKFDFRNEGGSETDPEVCCFMVVQDT